MRARLVLLFVAITLVASGCFRVHLDVEVNDDGSGKVTGLAALNVKAVQDLAGALAGDAGADDICAQFEEDQGLNDPTIDSAKPYKANGWCGVEFTDSFKADDFDQTLGSIAADGTVLERRGDGWYFEMPLDTDALGTSDLNGAEMLPGFEELLGEAEYIVRVKLPGKQVDYNADFIDNEGFAVWQIDITNPPTENLHLRTEAGQTIFGDKAPPGTRSSGGGGNTFVIVLVVVLILGAVALGIWLWSKNKQEPGHGTAASPAPDGDEDGTTVETPTAPDLPPPPSGADDTGRPLDLSGLSTADVTDEGQAD